MGLFRGSARGLFTPAQIQRLMRIEFERAQRHGYPIVFLAAAVDRLPQVQDLFGFEVKEEILAAAAALARATSRSSDLLGCTVDDRILILVPHTPPEGAGVLARRILAGARHMKFECEGRQVRVTLSIGGADNQRRRGEVSFETVLEVAEGGLAVAGAGGGDRYVHSELYEFFEGKRTREAPAPPPQPAAPAPEAIADPVARLLGDKIREMFGLGDEDGAILARIERAVIAETLRELREELSNRGGQSEVEYQRQIETLERRIAKLTAALGMTEQELQRVMRAKGIDPGVASIYRSVQGLSPDEVHAELKRELMKKIFTANVELRRKLSSGG